MVTPEKMPQNKPFSFAIFDRTNPLNADENPRLTAIITGIASYDKSILVITNAEIQKKALSAIKHIRTDKIHL